MNVLFLDAYVCAKYECCWNSCRVKKALRRLVSGEWRACGSVAPTHVLSRFSPAQGRVERRAEMWTPGLAAREGRGGWAQTEETGIWAVEREESCQLQATLRHRRHTEIISGNSWVKWNDDTTPFIHNNKVKILSIMIWRTWEFNSKLPSSIQIKEWIEVQSKDLFGWCLFIVESLKSGKVTRTIAGMDCK